MSNEPTKDLAEGTVVGNKKQTMDEVLASKHQPAKIQDLSDAKKNPNPNPPVSGDAATKPIVEQTTKAPDVIPATPVPVDLVKRNNLTKEAVIVAAVESGFFSRSFDRDQDSGTYDRVQAFADKILIADR